MTGEILMDDGLHVIQSFYLLVGDPLAPQPTPDPLQGYSPETSIRHTVNLISRNDRLVAIRIQIVPHDFKVQFHEYWSRYSVEEILSNYGIPDQIYTSAKNQASFSYSDLLLLTYHDSGAIIEYVLDNSDDLLCLDGNLNVRTFDMLLFDPVEFDSPSSLSAIIGVLPTVRSVYLPVDETIGIDRFEFFDQFLANPTSCFETKSSQ